MAPQFPRLPPTITSSRTVTGYRNAPFNYQIIATNNPSDFGVSGLPSGLSLNTRSGLISGIPTAAGTFRATIAAANASGATTEVLQVTIEDGTPVPRLPPTITSSRTVTGYRNAPFNYQIIATNNPSDFGASGLPSGLSLNSRSGLISGIPTAAGTFRPTIAAANAFGATTEVLQVTIENVLTNVSAPTLPTNPTMKRDMVLKPEGPTTENAQTLPKTIWHSYDVGTQSGSPQATMKDSLGLKTATLEFYESVNSGGVHKGGLLSIFVPGVHNESFNNLEQFWTVSTTDPDPYPYAGKSNVNTWLGCRRGQYTRSCGGYVTCSSIPRKMVTSSLLPSKCRKRALCRSLRLRATRCSLG